tara:strand:+ start:2176 stop:3321 length:1146 start_codon:yes stop_codon:yes gene_type:complete
MQVDDFEIIGKGSYGCVIKPALKCQDNKDIYNNTVVYKDKISKIQKKTDAEKENSFYKELHKLPGANKFILPKTILCKPHKDKLYKAVINKCQHPRVSKIVNDDKDYNLLLANIGKSINNYQNPDVFKSIQSKIRLNFYNGISNLIEGLIFFKKNNIIHHDIKFENIVFNGYNLYYIDFGLLINKSEKYLSDKQLYYNKSHHYYPPETSCLYLENFNDDKNEKCKNIKDKISSFKELVIKHSNTFDSYCLTDCFSDFFNDLVDYQVFDLKENVFLIESYNLFIEYCDIDILQRNDDLNNLLTKYNELLESYKKDILSKPDNNESLLCNESLDHDKSLLCNESLDSDEILKKAKRQKTTAKGKNKKTKNKKTKNKKTKNKKN